jgi:phospholipid/cholesterol/gamma-HCH transport system substrate-binding protein
VLAAFAVAFAIGALLGAGGGGGGAYRVRAVFDNASFLIPGEDVKIAGVKVGTIDAVQLTPANKAAVVLRIDDPAFHPFRRDASCRVGLQSLIGEQFVQCTPTQPRGAGVKPAPPLAEIRSGAGKGQHLLPVTNTVTPVNQDLLQNVLRLPQRQRLRLVINELGAGLASNGSELRGAIRRANPALQQTDQVIAVLARQDRVLARLVDDSDRVLAPLAARRRQLAGFVRKAGRTANATAAEGDALEADLRKLPGFLGRLRPAAADFGALADQMTPALDSLDKQAASINATVARLGPTAKLATPALAGLGKAADKGLEAFPHLEPTAHSLGGLAKPLLPLSMDLAGVSTSFDKTGGIEDVMRFIYNYTASINGEDELGHYIRGGLQVNVCSGRVSIVSPGCSSRFPQTATSASAASNRLLDYLLGKDAKP